VAPVDEAHDKATWPLPAAAVFKTGGDGTGGWGVALSVLELPKMIFDVFFTWTSK